MTIINPWVGYLDRNFISIKTRILYRMGVTVPEVTDHSDSNILVVIIEAFAGVAEMLNYYIDNMAREAFISTCRRYSSAVKHTRLIDYRIKAMIPASADITINFFNNDDSVHTKVGDSILPSGTLFKTANNVEFITTSDILIKDGYTGITVPVKQQTLVTSDILGVTDDSDNQVFNLGANYAHNTVEIIINGEAWLFQETLGKSGPLDKHFIVEVSANKEAFVKFGDNINGAIPTTGANVVATYFTTLGSKGNVEIGNINSSTFNFATLGIPKKTISNLFKAVAGTDFEDIERIRRSAPLSLRTLDRAVTKSDYRDIALLAPGVDKANIFFSCGKYVYLYISPNGGGLASSSLCNDVENFFDTRKMVTTFVKALPAGESQLYFDLEVTGRFRVNAVQLRNDLINLLLDKYSYNNSNINKATRLSDLMSLVDNYYKVDYLKVNRFYLKPYIKPFANNITNLVADIEIKNGSTSVNNWKIRYDGAYMAIFKNNTKVTDLVIGDTFHDLQNIMTIKIESGPYVNGMEWSFKTTPFNQDIVIDDYSVPVLSENNINLTVIEQTTVL